MKQYIIGLIVGIVLGIIITATPSLFEEKHKCKPTECYKPSFHETMFNIETYAIYIDSLTYGRKSQRKRYQDTVNKYAIILNAEQ